MITNLLKPYKVRAAFLYKFADGGSTCDVCGLRISHQDYSLQIFIDDHPTFRFLEVCPVCMTLFPNEIPDLIEGHPDDHEF